MAKNPEIEIHIVARCSVCKNVVAAAWGDDAEGTFDDAINILTWVKRGNSVAIEPHDPETPLVWCEKH